MQPVLWWSYSERWAGGLEVKLEHWAISDRAGLSHRGSRCVLGLNNVAKMKPRKAEGSGVEVSNRESEPSAHPLSITNDQSVSL